MTEQMNVPKLRFLDFSNTWRMEKLGKLVEINSGDSPSKFKMVEEGIPFFKVEQLNNSTKYQTDSIYFINEPKKVISKGSVIFPKRGASILLNKIRILKQPSFMDTNLMTLTANAQLNNEYLYYFILREDLSTLADTTSIPQINNKHILPYPIALPTLPEQQKIASFLSMVDEKISLLTEKKDKLAEYKKGVMQQLFSGKWQEQDEQLTFISPTLRFKADDGSEFPDWEEKTLIELAAQRFSNGVFNDPKRIGKGYRLINVKDMYSGNFIDTSTLSLLDLSEKEFSNNQVKYGDIFFTRSSLVPSGIAYSNVNLSNDNDITYDGHLIKFSPKLDMISPYYFANYLRSHSSRKSLISRGKQSTMTTIGQEDIKDIRFLIPSLEEQIKIANFLSAIDQKIDLANSELEQAKEWKKGLLQQMFV